MAVQSDVRLAEGSAEQVRLQVSFEAGERGSYCADYYNNKYN